MIVLIGYSLFINDALSPCHEPKSGKKAHGIFLFFSHAEPVAYFKNAEAATVMDLAKSTSRFQQPIIAVAGRRAHDDELDRAVVGDGLERRGPVGRVQIGV